ncbi:MAG: hypothetical protein CVV64_09485 [Candidatus Wallbacteria bacterium HGW-Wallbacteria-1]|jgi:hypothetical protein|uniref:Uncharacterized protein n=1 Tax=Candidatus Wallbacteria bacterium HGW-Wallbacteria-1 TaxID=2013854 RepID=A0A2N1PQH7_9BACT|nr:MAG: hypothetical protein CVV64_09485 [Candidatus Wallbacteria bacterium HGW-Wallbacteria-1]
MINLSALQKAVLIAFILMAVASPFKPPCHCSGFHQRNPDSSMDQLKTDRIDNLEILVLPTAERQFAFATFELQDPDMKKACFKALIKHFENEPAWCSKASIALAMLYVGDYRFPNVENAKVALTILRDIPRAYASQKSLCARSLWLCGWICQTIMKENDRARFFFDRVISEYSGIEADLDLPSTWEGLARLQKIKMTTGREKAEGAFELFSQLPGDTSSIFALSLALQEFTDDEVIMLAEKHIKGGAIHPIHTCRLLTRAWNSSKNGESKKHFADYITTNFSDIPTNEIQKAISLISGRNK